MAAGGNKVYAVDLPGTKAPINYLRSGSGFEICNLNFLCSTRVFLKISVLFYLFWPFLAFKQPLGSNMAFDLVSFSICRQSVLRRR